MSRTEHDSPPGGATAVTDQQAAAGGSSESHSEDRGKRPAFGSGVPAISAKGLYKVFGKGEKEAAEAIAAGTFDPTNVRGTAAVINANFEVARGETFVVMGLSGSGKSTLIRMLNGLNPVTAGTVEINGTPLTSSGEELRRIRRDELSMVFQHFALLPNRTVLANVGFGLEVRKVDKDKRDEQSRYWLERVGLTGVEDKFPNELSGGMQQRVGLARALAAETDILLMDEAFSALDPVIRADLQSQLLELQAELGKTIVFITHDLNEAMRLGDRVAIMRRGEIVQIGSASDILTNPANDYVSRFVSDVDRSRVLTAGMIADDTAPVLDPDLTGDQILAELQRTDHTAAAVREGSKILGSLTLAAAQQNPTATARELVDSTAAVPRGVPIGQLLHRSANQEAPLVVTDRSGKLLGLLARDRILESLASPETFTPADSVSTKGGSK